MAELRQDRTFLRAFPAFCVGQLIIFGIGVPWLAVSADLTPSEAIVARLHPVHPRRHPEVHPRRAHAPGRVEAARTPLSAVPLLPERGGVGVGVPVLRRLLAIALAAVVAAAVLAAPAAAHPNMSVTFEAPRDLLDPATRDSALAELDTLGVRSLRVVLYWKDVAPDPNGGRPQLDETDPANYDWSKYDPLIAGCERARLAGPADRVRARSRVGRPAAAATS